MLEDIWYKSQSTIFPEIVVVLKSLFNSTLSYSLILSFSVGISGATLLQSPAFCQADSKLKEEEAAVRSEEKELKNEIEELSKEEQLKGHVKEDAGGAVCALKELLSSVVHLKRSVYDVFCEVQREDLVVVGEPNVIGPMIVPAIPSGSGLLNTGEFLPARKKWIDYYMAQIEKLYPMVTKELEALKLPGDATADMKDHYRKVVLAYNKLGPALKDLDEITQGPKYDNKEIAKCSAVGQNYLDAIDKELKRLYREMKKVDRDAGHADSKIDRKIEADKRKLKRDEKKIKEVEEKLRKSADKEKSDKGQTD